MSTSHKGILHAHQSFLSLAHRLLDLAVVAGGTLWADWLHHRPLTSDSWCKVLLAVLVFHWLGEYNTLYGSWRGERVIRELRRVATYWCLTFVCLLLANELLPQNEALTPVQQVQAFAVVLAILGGYRLVIRSLLHSLRKRGYNTRNVAIVGTGQVGERLARSMAQAPWMGLRLFGFYDDQPQQMNLSRSGRRIIVQGGLDQLIEHAHEGRIDKVYITLPMVQEPVIKGLVKALSDTTASVYLIPDVFMFDLLHARSESINGLASISLIDSPMEGSSSLIKRLEDIVASSLILAMIAVPMLLIAAAIKLTSRGPVLFRQLRYGLDGRPIKVWKFRSMTVQENGTDVRQASRDDVRVTPLGKVLRRTSLDELPQFFNVLLGDMSIVGPRPHAVAHNEQYRRLVSCYMLRHKVKPGITGWAQVNGWRGETNTLDKMQKRVEFDLDYIERWSVWLDVKIIALTLFKGFVNKNAY
ncbi:MULTISPECIES: undecaprenyl-phosphate glucose phosphotransferase [Pseudomonas]|uniref:Undecaprenyl-phosphate glucose phosphotransferase n=1 Tax=Pseudomonas quercus TaxID=2722792 RepID=A0ABX0YHB8_9PSED|nr:MULTISPECIES: undecaprenyl-phosphate glucose phosphotransferase [Pseudomonas]MBF7144297.1 undecaprenyl-phosphate glucose phosphotransferase [Pseudomonas sp. LY10J]NJP02836.1 undecaprenyl-phosphate glucose phosphotransferase [Pseudomonas quercus]